MRYSTTRAGRGSALTLSALTVALSLGAWGCSSPQTELTVTSLEKHETFQQNFTHAYASRNDHGDLDVVLACDTCRQDGTVQPGLRQLVHLRVLWSPVRGYKADQPAATNAAIHWYVFNESAAATDMIEYAGTGMVAIDPDGDVTTLKIKNADLKPTAARGPMRDPIGLSKFDGTVVAHRDPKRVNELLSEVKTSLAASTLTGVRQAAADIER